jgi:hypothetical protein
MDLKHKHWALIFIGILVAAFIILAAWYTLGSKKALAPTGETSSSTPQTAATTTAPASPEHITEHANYYDIDLTYPAATPFASVNADANARAVAAMKGAMTDTAAQFKTDGNFANLTQQDIELQHLGERKYALSSEYKTYTGARTVSYVFTIYEDTLGAHPNGYYRTFTFDTKTGAQLALGSLFQPSSQYLERLSARTRADLPSIIEQKAGGMGDADFIQDGTKPEEASFQNFYIDGKNLVIVFPPYQVGPYALGTIEDPIPLGQLSDMLNPTYLPS